MRLLLVLIVLPLAAQEPRHLEVFLLMGQSNMAGRGVVEEQDRRPLPRVWVLDAEMKWKPATDPLHFDKPQIAGVGLGRSFAQVLTGLDARAEIGLVPCAVGGSSLKEWAPGGAQYKAAVQRARAAMKSGRLRGVLWHQGEAETSEETLAQTYGKRWTAMMLALRKDLGVADLPAVVGQLGGFLTSRADKPLPLAHVVNVQLALLPIATPGVAFVSSAGLDHKGDYLHFDSASLRGLGRRYALAFLTLDASWPLPGGQ